VSLRKTGDTDSDPYGSKNYTAGLPEILSCPLSTKKRAYLHKSFLL